MSSRLGQGARKKPPVSQATISVEGEAKCLGPSEIRQSPGPPPLPSFPGQHPHVRRTTTSILRFTACSARPRPPAPRGPTPSYGGVADGLCPGSQGTLGHTRQPCLCSGLCLWEPREGWGPGPQSTCPVIYCPAPHCSWYRPQQLLTRVGQCPPPPGLLRAALCTCPSSPPHPKWLPVRHLGSRGTAEDRSPSPRGTRNQLPSAWVAKAMPVHLWQSTCERQAVSRGLEVSSCPLCPPQVRENTFLIETHLYIYIYMCVYIRVALASVSGPSGVLYR